MIDVVTESKPPSRAVLLSIGDEIVSGQTTDQHAPWLSSRLAEVGIETVEHRTVGDDREGIARTIADLAAAGDVLILTGGLGPTPDDLTRFALRDVLTPDRELVRDESAEQHLRAWFAGRPGLMPETNHLQALRPSTMRVLPNPAGTACGLAGEHKGVLIFSLPGPPHEMRRMFRDHVAPQLAGERDVAMRGQTVQEFGLGESAAAERLGTLLDRNRDPVVGTTASQSIVSARIRARGDAEEVDRALEETASLVEEAWQPYTFGRAGATLASAVGRILSLRGESLCTVESCTGGLLGDLIVDVAGSSVYYRGGWITYSNEMKERELAVPSSTIARYGAVSTETARAMATGALNRCHATWSLAITGVAGPSGGSVDKPVGCVFIACARQAEPATGLMVFVRRFVFPGTRATIRDRAAKSALQMLRFRLLGVSDEIRLLWEQP